jgi:hypothetical protein
MYATNVNIEQKIIPQYDEIQLIEKKQMMYHKNSDVKNYKLKR